MTHAEDKPAVDAPEGSPTPITEAEGNPLEEAVPATATEPEAQDAGAETVDDATAAEDPEQAGPETAEPETPEPTLTAERSETPLDTPAEALGDEPEVATPPPTQDVAEEAPAKPAARAESEAPKSESTLRLIAAKQSGEPIEGKVIGWNRGGFHVSLDGVTAFCPRSMMEIGNPRKPESYLDQTFGFRIAEIHEKARRVVVSRQELLREERKLERAQVRETLEVGATLTGRIDSLTDFGAFVSVGGGLRGLIHLSEMSRKRVEHPNDVVNVGDQVQVQITKLEKGGDRISLSLKALEPDPWQGIEERHPRGAGISGTVARSSDFGLFVEVEEGVEGLIHVSQLPIGAKLDDATFAEGATVEGWVREVDLGRRRLSLTMRELPETDPWKGITTRIEDGALIEGVIEQVTRFGFFVELEPGLTGLLPFAAVTAPAGRKKEQAYRPGQSLKVQIHQIDPKRRRISLGLEGSTVGGTQTDLRNYMKQQKGDTGGLNAMAAAFAKLKSTDDE